MLYIHDLIFRLKSFDFRHNGTSLKPNGRTLALSFKEYVWFYSKAFDIKMLRPYKYLMQFHCKEREL